MYLLSRIKAMALTTLRPVQSGPEWDVLDSRDGDGVSVTVLGNTIQPFQAVITDTTMADVSTSKSKNATNIALPINIPHGGGPVRFNVVLPVDQLLNLRSMRVKLGYKLLVREADGTSRNIVAGDAITWNM